MRSEIYANNAGTSWPKAPPVVETVSKTLRADPAEFGAIFARARERIAGAFGIDVPSQLLLTPGCTSALAAILTSLPWATGDVVVTSAVEHQALLRPIESLVRMRGVVHRAVGYRPGAPFDLDAFDALMDAGRVRAVAVTAASNVTGECLPVEAIAQRARSRGVVAIVDAAQVAGLVPLDVGRLGAHAVAFAGHKGPLGPQGVGGLWVDPGLELAVHPGYCDVGSVDLAGAAGLAASLAWLDSPEAPPRDHALRLRRRLVDILRDRPGVHVFGGDGPATAAVSVRVDGLGVERAEDFFLERGIVVRAGRHCAPQALQTLGEPDGTIRVSFGPLNRDADVDAIAAAIDHARQA